MKFNKVVLFILLIVWFQCSHASTASIPLSNVSFAQDQQSLQRGATIYYKLCRACHDMKYIRFSNLKELGFTKEQIDALRGDEPMKATMSKTVTDDVLKVYYGQVPPDLSVMAKARKKGPQYIYTLMSSYSEQDGKYDNALFPGIKMPDVMDISTAIDQNTKDKITGDIKDVTEYLLWASDPRAGERKTIGVYVIGYFIILSILLYFIMQRVWSRLE